METTLTSLGLGKVTNEIGFKEKLQSGSIGFTFFVLGMCATNLFILAQ
jgi:hypothetical protein